MRPSPRNCADDIVGTITSINAINATYRLTGLIAFLLE
jgi:hypothetical protein